MESLYGYYTQTSQCLKEADAPFFTKIAQRAQINQRLKKKSSQMAPSKAEGAIVLTGIRSVLHDGE
ncbi:hypothetical protein Caka_0759 [Coraliomargarita akajimensis DSM 45221]|uniref:Uncharacterized protein n=1 Tax=Coraliomargarita akajimensis (strain DSM 45221 / IAM 15411 / JCM 23193 / KCTC 12865 / 04OKA010-24) TaxID=583355 RepID=D5EPP6_CORAD|nr:hypothetical protein Caka_0759 [Coraliomargarita akajimensis DSM 45221]